MTRSLAALVGFVLVCLGTGFLGSIATARSLTDWYPSINKPSINPPDWVFAPVWTGLFVMMGVAAWLVWKRADFSVAWLPLTVFGVQLALNLLWSILFFGLQNPGLALAEIWVLWLAILATIWVFQDHSRTAALLLVPYLGWVSFAAYLNFMIWRLNR
jgi:benzodiazapine receptor